MKTITKTLDELIKPGSDSPIDLDAIWHDMGIILGHVKSITWTEHDNGHIDSLLINFNEYQEPWRENE